MQIALKSSVLRWAWHKWAFQQQTMKVNAKTFYWLSDGRAKRRDDNTGDSGVKAMKKGNNMKDAETKELNF